MSKDKNWLKEQLKHEEIELKYAFDNYEQYEKVLIADDVIDLLNQLEEPEITEEQAWGAIETYNHQHIAPAYVKVYKNYIQQGILPSEIVKQEKVVVPQFVGDWIEKNRDKTTLLDTKAMMIQRCINDDSRVLDWVDDNDDLFIRAWLYGYSVEEQKLYFVKEPITGQFLVKDIKQSSGVKWVDGFSSDSERYSEQEIKAIDERFWAFADEITK